jgi:hypothetical protein
MYVKYPKPSGSQFSKKQQDTFLRRFGVDVIKDGSPVRVIFESEKVETNDAVSVLIYVTARHDTFVEDDIFSYEGTNYKVSYKEDDFSGLTNFYISLESSDGRKSKYE